jgi:polysaccharide export outer membrane protein
MSISRLLGPLAVLFAAACHSSDADRPPLLTTDPNAAQRASPRVDPEIEAWFRGTAAAAGVRIMPGDRLSISVRDHDELHITPDVPPNGEIRIPRENKTVVVVNALGKTPQDLVAAVEAVHAADLEHPYVDVQIDVAAPRSIYVLGAVKAQNAYAVSENGRLTVLQALALAGGTTEHADLSGVTIQRVYARTGESVTSPPLDIRSVIENHDQRDNLVVEPGDTIMVPERPEATVQVLGHAERPGIFPWRKGMRLSEAIAAAGSFAKFAKKSAIKIVRNGRDSIVVDYDEVLEGKIPDPELQPGDVIFIDERYL